MDHSTPLQTMPWQEEERHIYHMISLGFCQSLYSYVVTYLPDDRHFPWRLTDDDISTYHGVIGLIALFCALLSGLGIRLNKWYLHIPQFFTFWYVLTLLYNNVCLLSSQVRTDNHWLAMVLFTINCFWFGYSWKDTYCVIDIMIKVGTMGLEDQEERRMEEADPCLQPIVTPLYASRAVQANVTQGVTTVLHTVETEGVMPTKSDLIGSVGGARLVQGRIEDSALPQQGRVQYVMIV